METPLSVGSGVWRCQGDVAAMPADSTLWALRAEGQSQHQEWEGCRMHQPRGGKSRENTVTVPREGGRMRVAILKYCAAVNKKYYLNYVF